MDWSTSLNEIAAELGLDSLAPDAKRTILLEADLPSPITLKLSVTACAFSYPLSKELSTAYTTSQDKLTQLLNWQFFHQKDHRDALTYDPDTEQLLLTTTVSDKLIQDSPLYTFLESFLNSVEFWTQALSGTNTSSSHPSLKL